MSEFDKEAEREKLREKYADDADDRAATQRMSQLLLQGATMTNRHCDECGDPRFRYQGREFCPSCEGIEGATPVESEDSDSEEDSETQQERAAETEGPGEQPPASAEATDRQPAEETPTPEDARASIGQDPTGERHRAPQSAQGTPDARSAAGGQPIDGDLAEARRTLARSVRSLAERGATAEDPRRAREHLEAAREAAEALAALNR
jgi:uncharacterized Zn finger protein (UPF0148 family)